MIERLLILIVLSGLEVAGYRLFRRWQVCRAARLAPCDPLLQLLRPGIPAILYFTSPTCVPCKTQQRPAIQRLLSELGDRVQVIEVDALEQPDAADRWGVLSIPTTFILDRQGQPRTVNYGVTRADKLKHQLLGL
ncbi:MAG: thioredoxin [Chloroflexi bacterium]|nr:MAG: thioredoxin [Chloroflexota bacterium]